MKKYFLVAAIVLTGTALVINACKSSKTTTTTTTTTTTPKKDDKCGDGNITYENSIKAIIDLKCAGCHKAGSNIESKGVFTSYATSKVHLMHMYHETVDERTMPPVKAQQLTQEEIELWKCWKANGFKEK